MLRQRGSSRLRSCGTCTGLERQLWINLHGGPELIPLTIRAALVGGSDAFCARLRLRGARSSHLRLAGVIVHFGEYAAPALSFDLLEHGWRLCWMLLRLTGGNRPLNAGNLCRRPEQLAERDQLESSAENVWWRWGCGQAAAQPLHARGKSVAAGPQHTE